MNWSIDALFAKAKLYMERADEEDANSTLFPFWASLSLEFLCRAALSSVHPSLLADPREGANLLYACGIEVKTAPRLIPAKTVFDRCQSVIPTFDKSAFEYCIMMSELRNAELHSGEAAFEGLDTGRWLPRHYELAEVVLTHINKSLEDYLGDDGAERARAMLDDMKRAMRANVEEKISACRKWYAQLSADERHEKVDAVTGKVDELTTKFTNMSKVACPACGVPGIVRGKVSGYGKPKIRDDEVRVEMRVLPNEFRCGCCSLSLSGYGELNHAGVGSIFAVDKYEDPVEFFNIDVNDYVDVDELMREYVVDDDYGND
jgi:hypothetical protein